MAEEDWEAIQNAIGIAIERAERAGVPIIPRRKLPTLEPNPIVAVCGECGLELRRVMGYACPLAQCPCGLGPRICFTVTA